MTDQPHVTMTTDELAIELFTTSQIVNGRGEAERLLQQVKDQHAHELAELLRDQCDCGDMGTCRCSCADRIDPKAQP